MIQPSQLDLTTVIPTKDRPKLLSLAIDSVLTCLPEAAEVLIVDDRSVVPLAGLVSGLDTRVRITASQATPGAGVATPNGAASKRARRPPDGTKRASPR